MEIEKLIFALEETLSYLRSSPSYDQTHVSIEDIIRRLEAEVAKAKKLKPIDVNLLEHLFAPTGALQKISIENGWGTKFLRISEIVDQFVY